MILKRQSTGQRAVTSRNTFFSPADIFHVMCHTICHPAHLLCQETYAGNRKRPQTTAAPLPKTHRPIDFTKEIKSIKGKWRFHPFPSTGIRIWLLQLLGISVNLRSAAQPHRKQRLGLHWSGTAGVTCEIGPAALRPPDPFHAKLLFSSLYNFAWA